MLKVVEMLRAKGVVSKFVEFYGEGLDHLPLADRATIANMAPEYGATMGFFPIDKKTVDFMRYTGRTEDEVTAFEKYFRAQNMFGMPKEGEIKYSKTIELGVLLTGLYLPMVLQFVPDE